MNSLKKMKDNVIFLSVHLLKGSYMICMFLLSSLYFFIGFLPMFLLF